jgi:hypothetical protein
MTTLPHERRHTATWAFVLIGLGVIWLLAQANVFSGANLAVLFRLWPILLIALGLELLFGRSNRGLSLLIGGGAVVLLLALMLVGPSIGLAPNIDVKTAQYTEPLGSGVRAAHVNLSFPVGRNTVQALTDSSRLFDADLRYVGDLKYNVSGASDEPQVTLSAENASVPFYDVLGLFRASSLDDQELRWNIGLSPNVPLDLRLNGGVGDSTIDLSGLMLTSLDFSTGVGDSTISLPGSGSYPVSLNGGVGTVVVNFADGAAVNARVDAGVGSITLDVPDDAPVRLQAEGGLGGVHVPSGYTRISGQDTSLDHSGVWESPAYAAASGGSRIDISFNGGVGDLTIR